MSSWTRGIVIPLSILHASDPQRPVPEGFDLKELFVEGVPLEFFPITKAFSVGAISS